MNLIEPRLLKGFRDFDPTIQLARQDVLNKIRSVFEEFGFLPLETPALEYKDILMGKYGDDEKLVYSFEDNGGREVAMRYDLTVPLARYVAQNQGSINFPFKRYQVAPVWRADNPQKGRFREFYQCDVDVVGSSEELTDADVIACLCKALEAIGVSNYRVRINDRAVLAFQNTESIRILDKVDKIGIDGVVNEMRTRKIPVEDIELAVQLAGGKANDIPERLRSVINLLGEYDLRGQVDFDPTIARGLDYYSSTVFEIFLNDKPEYGSICSGGRYDGLLDQFSKQGLPAVGGSIGIDRLFEALAELGLLPDVSAAKVIILNMEQGLLSDYVKLASGLRAKGVATEIYYENNKLDKQFKYAEKRGIDFAIIMGEEEKARGIVQLKNLNTRTQEELTISDLYSRLAE